MVVNLSSRTKKLLSDLQPILKDAVLQDWKERELQKLTLIECVEWLQKPTVLHGPSRVVLEEFRESLLIDLNRMTKTYDEEKKPNKLEKAKYNFLIISGLLLAICGGFSGITAILSLFSVPTAILFGVGFVFSAISVAFFYHFDRVQISRLFGIELEKSHQLLDICTEEIKQIKKCRKYLQEKYSQTRDIKELQTLFETARMLEIRYQQMDDIRAEYAEKLNHPMLKAVKIAAGTFKTGLVLTTGFLGGQSFALAIAGLFVSSITVTAWPIVVASIILSISALGLFYYMQRQTYVNSFGALIGLNQEKIKAFIDKKEVSHQKSKLQSLSQSIEEKIVVQTQLNEMLPEANFKEPKVHQASPLPSLRFFTPICHSNHKLVDEHGQSEMSSLSMTA